MTALGGRCGPPWVGGVANRLQTGDSRLHRAPSGAFEGVGAGKGRTRAAWSFGSSALSTSSRTAGASTSAAPSSGRCSPRCSCGRTRSSPRTRSSTTSGASASPDGGEDAAGVRVAASEGARRSRDDGERPTARLETHGHGYVLRIAPESLDADAFQRRACRGTAGARTGRRRSSPSSRSATRSRSGAGPALADLAYESFAQPEIARLEELRLSRDRGTHRRRPRARAATAELIGELETLVERHPLRERLRGQLMLALYRSGRQAEALQVFQDGRQHLAAELGLEPGEALRRLERQILEQDPELGASSRRARPAIVPASAWRHPVRVAVAGAVVLAVAVGVGAWRLAGDEAEHGDRRRDRARPRHRRRCARRSPSAPLLRASPWGRGASGCSTATTRR